MRSQSNYERRNEICYLCAPVPALAVLAFDEGRGLRAIRRLHGRAVPFHELAFTHAKSNTTQEDDLGQVGRDVEVRIGRLAALTGFEPLIVVADGARDAHRDDVGLGRPEEPYVKSTSTVL